MGTFTGKNYWGLILGGSSGIGWATAAKLAKEGMNLCIVHRDRRSALQGIDDKFNELKTLGIEVIAFNQNALSDEARGEMLDELTQAMKDVGKVRVMVHAISRGNLKLLAPIHERKYAKKTTEPRMIDQLKLLLDVSEGESTDNQSFLAEKDFQITIQAMATSLLTWVEDVRQRNLFSADARVIGLTSEGNQKAWRNYAAIATAKATLEALVRSMALEYAPYGIRTNVVQAGITDTPSFRMIPGYETLMASALIRNPMGRLTQPEDVANVIYLLSKDEATWINGALIKVDGGESVC